MMVAPEDSTVRSKRISIVTPAYNEEGNIQALYLAVHAIMQRYPQYVYEHIFIDNHSTDSTVDILKQIAAKDRRVKIIVNARNFGHIRSAMHALLQASGDAVIGIASDFQEPPDLIPQMLEAWEEGSLMVLCVKRSSEEHGLMYWLRKKYYQTVERLSSVETIQNYTGFGLYDRRVVDLVRSFKDPYPYFRGIIAEISLPKKLLYFDQPVRKRGITKNNWYILYDIALLGIVSTSKVPLRIATISGFLGAAISFVVGFVYLLLKLIFWQRFTMGVAPMLIGMFFMFSVECVFLGLLGEYVGAIYTRVQERPYVIEQERINFQYGFPEADQAELPHDVLAADA
jgi:polyisoprenyl-phosphate glycosyltransferase